MTVQTGSGSSMGLPTYVRITLRALRWLVTHLVGTTALIIILTILAGPIFYDGYSWRDPGRLLDHGSFVGLIAAPPFVVSSVIYRVILTAVGGTRRAALFLAPILILLSGILFWMAGDVIYLRDGAAFTWVAYAIPASVIYAFLVPLPGEPSQLVRAVSRLRQVLDRGPRIW